MQIKEMFRKEIDRELQGVIVVGQGAETNVAQELEEYVVTRELQRHFADFFAAYKKGILGTTPKMGVWISGFFGSGKSHFLKILSYLLENKQVVLLRLSRQSPETCSITDFGSLPAKSRKRYCSAWNHLPRKTVSFFLFFQRYRSIPSLAARPLSNGCLIFFSSET